MRRRLLLPALVLAACKPGVAPTIVASPPDRCTVAPSGTPRAESLSVAVEGSVDPGFPLQPRSPAERFIFAQVYETLVHVDCDDRLVPALAERWTGDSTGRLWTLTLRADATFSDGAPISAEDVAAAWRERRVLPAVSRDPAGPAVDGITIESAHTITVHLRDAHREGPRILAHPDFAVHRTVVSRGVRLGSGSYTEPSLATLRTSRDAPIRLVPRSGGEAPVLAVWLTPSGDARDAIDRGVDITLTGDRRVIEYASLRSGLRTTPLTPDRTYVLLSTLRHASVSDGTNSEATRWSALRAALARDVVRATPTPDMQSWWGAASTTPMCDSARPVPPAPRARAASGARSRRLVYAASDRLAGDLAQRLIALATYQGGTPETIDLPQLLPEWFEHTDSPFIAVGLSDSEVERSLMTGSDLGYVVALPRRALDACVSWRQFSARAPWVPAGLSLVLAEAGPSLITSTHASPVTFDWDNTLRVSGAKAPGPTPR